MAEIWLEGQAYDADDLTFREQRKLRDYMRELAPNNDVEEASDADFFPALICVIKQRSEEAFTLEQALDFKESDLSGPPTKKAAAAK